MDVEHDIFVSYAHGDTRAHVEAPALRTWTRKLVENLKEDLALGGRRPGVWYDYELQGNEPLTPTLKGELAGSALLVVVMTPAYLVSAWCQRELGWFEQQVRRRGGVAGDVFVVDAWPTDRARWPAFLQDADGETLVGYPFHDGRADKVDPEVRPHGWRLPKDDDTAYFDALAKLGGSITKRLDARKPANTPDGAARMPHLGGPRLYLAWGTDDVAKRRGELRDQLCGRGVAVLPDPEPAAPADLATRLDADLRGCRAFVQLLGSHGGSWEGDPAGPVAWQRARAKEAGLPILAWRNHKIPLAAIDDDAYRALFEQWSPGDFADAEELARQALELIPAAPVDLGGDQIPATAYLDAEITAELTRQDTLNKLKNPPELLVVPSRPRPVKSLKEIEAERQARLSFYARCHALLLLHADDQSDWIEHEFLRFVQEDRWRVGRSLACAVVDRVGGAAGWAPNLGFEQVFDWADPRCVEKMREWLRSLAGAAAPIARAAE